MDLLSGLRFSKKNNQKKMLQSAEMLACFIKIFKRSTTANLTKNLKQRSMVDGSFTVPSEKSF